ncbi:hypothetical protein INR49_000875 [Caranx melampygus]|nr:hypothetical protein INR49_000875 [Caranx melampygus]
MNRGKSSKNRGHRKRDGHAAAPEERTTSYQLIPEVPPRPAPPRPSPLRHSSPQRPGVVADQQ